MSHNVEAVEGPESLYGSLTNSLIFPNAGQLPPMPPPNWQGPTRWQQSNGMIENGYTNFYPGQMVGAAPNYMYNDSELPLYDEGEEDFYGNQPQWESHDEAEAPDEEHNNVTGTPLTWLLQLEER